MKHLRTLISAAFLLGIFLTETQAQEIISVTGGVASGSGGTASYSIGQMVYETHTGTGGSVAEGVQHPFEISVITAIEEFSGIKLMVSAYPNPTSDFLILKVDNYNSDNLSFHIFDINGKLIETKRIEGSRTNIAMSYLIPGTYFVKVLQENRELKTFKIIKNKNQ